MGSKKPRKDEMLKLNEQARSDGGVASHTSVFPCMEIPVRVDTAS